MSSPSRRTLPDRHLKRPDARLSKVVLPAPFAPSSATTEESGTRTVTSCKTVIEPYPAATSTISSTGPSDQLTVIRHPDQLAHMGVEPFGAAQWPAEYSAI